LESEPPPDILQHRGAGIRGFRSTVLFNYVTGKSQSQIKKFSDWRKDLAPNPCVFSIPRTAESLEVVTRVEQDNHRLPQHNSQPENNVSCLSALEILCETDEGHLHHHAPEGEQLEVAELLGEMGKSVSATQEETGGNLPLQTVQPEGKKNELKQNGILETEQVSYRDAHDELVHDGRDDKDYERSRLFSPSPPHQWKVDMRDHPCVHWEIPTSPEVAQICGVPPIPIELPIPAQHMCQSKRHSAVRARQATRRPSQSVKQQDVPLAGTGLDCARGAHA
jgi:hypothetical protein